MVGDRKKIIVRPYNAEDNETNQAMRKILEAYLNKINAAYDEIEIYGESVIIKTLDGKEYQMNKAQGCRMGTSYNQRIFFYMTENSTGKRIRINKKEW